MCYSSEDGLLDELEGFADDFSGFLKKVAKTIDNVARQAAPIVIAIPIPQSQLIGDAAELISYVLGDALDSFANELRGRAGRRGHL